MDANTTLWLFGGCISGIVTSFGFAWRCHSLASNKLSKMSDDFYAYKIHVAEHFASVTYATAIEGRTVNALDEIKASLLRHDEKLDKLMSARGR